MAVYLNDVVNYFKGLAENHPELLHNEASGSRVYEVIAYEEAFGDFRTAASEKGYFMRFILPTLKWDGHQNNAHKKYQIGLMVGKWYSTREDVKTVKIDCWSDSEKVLDDIIARMVYDSREGHAVFNHSADSVDALDLSGDYMDHQGDGSYAAVMYLFNIGAFRCIDSEGSEFQAVGWLDL